MDQLLEVRQSHEGRRIDDIVLCEAHSDGHDHRDQRKHQKQNYRWCYKQPSHPILLANYLLRFFSLFSLSHASSPFRFVYVIYYLYHLFFILDFFEVFRFFLLFSSSYLVNMPIYYQHFCDMSSIFYINICIISVISFCLFLFLATLKFRSCYISFIVQTDCFIP